MTTTGKEQFASIISMLQDVAEEASALSDQDRDDENPHGRLAAALSITSRWAVDLLEATSQGDASACKSFRLAVEQEAR